jgi:hypothetical protein
MSSKKLVLGYLEKVKSSVFSDFPKEITSLVAGKRPSRIVFPKVNSLTQPVIIVLTRFKDRLSGEHFFCKGFITAVKAEDKGGEHRVHDLLELRFQSTVLIVHTHFAKKLTSLVGRLFNFRRKFPHRTNFSFDFHRSHF